MADAGDPSVELLFFDTFSHENTEELNLDLVQFPCPVIIYEVRIIPLRAQVQANLPGGVRLGATNPSSFKLELFINNLSRPSAATFEKLGLLDYKENTNIQLKPEAEVPTDGLVLKGWYNTVTVAVYGCMTTVKPVKASPPPPPPPPRKVQEPRHEPAMTEEELCKSAPTTQHPLDFIQHQLQQLQQRYPQSQQAPQPGPSGAPPTGAAPSGPPTPSSRDIFKPFEQMLQPHPARGDREREIHDQRDARDQRDVRDQKRDFTFPPEPKEPYDARDRDRESSGRDPHDENRSRDSRDRDDWEYRREPRDRRGSRDSDSRDSHDFRGSREGSQEGRDFRDRDRDQPPMPPEEEMEVTETVGGEEGDDDAEIYENLSDNSPAPEGFDQEPQDGEDGYEDISSDDELNDGEEAEMIPCYLAPLGMFRDPSLSLYEVEVCGYEQLTQSEQQRPAEAQSLMDVIGQLGDVEHTDKWVSGLETAPPLMNKGLGYLVNVEKRKLLLDWTMEGLDQDKAMQQPEGTFKVRHLKMGIALATSLLQCSPSVAKGLITRGVQYSLLNLLESPYMAFSIRLQILKALDASLRFPDGVRWFLGSHPEQEARRDSATLTCYQRTVQLMTKKQLAQVMMGLKALLHKVHTYETFMKLRAAIDHVLDSLPSVDEEETPHKTGGEEDGEEDLAPPESSLPVEEEDVDKIVACLEEIHRLFAQPQHLISQPSSLLPVKSLSDKEAKPADVYPAVFRLAYHCRLLECLFVLLSTPALASQAAVFVVVRRVIRTVLQTQEGLLFLSTRPDTTNGIIRSLVQMTDEACEEAGEDMLARQLGLEMVYHLQTLQHIDQLFEYLKKVGDNIKVDDAEPLGILHSLYSMTFTPGLRDCVMGRRAIAHVLGLATNLNALLPFIQPTGDEAKDVALRKSVSWGYTTQLITMVIMYSEGSQLIEKFGSRLLAISEDAANSSKLAQLQEWLAPVKKLTSFGVEDVGTMATLLKTYAEDAAKLPPEVPTPLHHTYVLVELYSADCFPVLINILQKLSELQLKPWQQGIPQSLDHWTMFFAAVVPALAIVRATLSLIIKTRGSEFKDLTVLPTLFELHTVLCSVPSSTLYSQDTLSVQKNIVDTLLAFTQPDFKSQGEEALSSSLWTLMMKEVIRYPVKSPYVYMSGLLLISELVPLPFPLLTKELLSDEEVSLAVNTRKLWSAHLHPLMPDIHNVISLLAGTGCQPLLCLLRRVCWQIADLAAPSATIIA
ncbi:hypothetical protein BaRGS_00008538, partial [Batillaria attramentaria]